jgi:hypothetical protein
MVNHCAKENYSMIQWPVFVFLNIMNVYTYTINFVPSLCSELGVNAFWLLMFCGFSLCNFLLLKIVDHMLYVSSLLKHLSNALNIQIFKIKSPEEEVPLTKKYF